MFITHVRYLQFYVIGSTGSNFCNTIEMAEGETSDEILPYGFEPVSVSNCSDRDTSNRESDTETG